MAAPPIERASAVDLMELAAATTPAAGQVGAVLELAPGAPVGLAAVRAAVEARTRAVPRLRQVLRRTPPGCGRPVWVDDPAWDVAHHVTAVPCPAPGDERAVLAVAAERVAADLPADRPPWSIALVRGLADGSDALVLVFHHVLADGIGGLAVLAHLVDGAAVPPSPPTPRPAPTTAALAAEAWSSRLGALRRLPTAPDRLRAALAELASGRARAPRCSLNAPVGPHRALAVARTDLAAVHAAAHVRGATVNDAVLVAVVGAVAELARRRDEAVDELVASIPVSARRAATATELGNAIGVAVVPVPAVGSPDERLVRVAAATRARTRNVRGASAVLLAPAFRLLGAVGALRWATDHQRSVSTFVTNLRGPEEPVAFLDRTVTALLPISTTSGNVRAAFGAFSYAGTLSVTVVADAGIAGALPELVDELEAGFAALGAGTGTADRPGPERPEGDRSEGRR